MKTGAVGFLCIVALATAASNSTQVDDSPNATNSSISPDAQNASKAIIPATPAKDVTTTMLPPTTSVEAVAPVSPPKIDEIYSGARKVPSKVAASNATKTASPATNAEKATSLSGDVSDIDASVRERIEQDSQKISKVAESLVGVQGDINRVEKEVLGKVFDMSTMKAFLNEHEQAIKEHEKLDQEQEDLTKQATSLSKQLDKAINDTNTQDRKHRTKMAQLSSQVAEDKAVIQGLQKELIPLVEMQKEVAKLPPVNANQTAENTRAVAAAQAATEELVYERSKLQAYQDTTKNLMKELVKQHDYATKCHGRLHQLNTQLHEIAVKEARMKYEQNRAGAQGAAMEKSLEQKNAEINMRLKKSKKNLATINFAKANMKAKIEALQGEGQIKLEKLKAELGKLRQQSASIETAMMAKITNRKLIEKALRGASLQVEDMQAKLLAGRLDKLRRNNTQMTKDLNQIRQGLQKAQINTAKAESQRMILLSQAAEYKQHAANRTAEAQDVAREALAKVVAARAEDDAMSEKAQKATLEAQAAMLTKCSAIWDKEHRGVLKKLKQCKQTKVDLDATKAAVASLTSTVKAR